MNLRVKGKILFISHMQQCSCVSIFYLFYLILILLIFKYSSFHFSPSSPPPRHTHFPPSILPLLALSMCPCFYLLNQYIYCIPHKFIMEYYCYYFLVLLFCIHKYLVTSKITLVCLYIN